VAAAASTAPNRTRRGRRIMRLDQVKVTGSEWTMTNGFSVENRI
jgi:hypothetical protein